MVKGLVTDPVGGPRDEPLSAPPNWHDPPDNERARDALRFIQGCPHTKGQLRTDRKALGDTWLPWQERLTRHLFGTLTSDGLRAFTTAYVEMPKKSGKSSWMAAVMLYLLGPATKPGAELYSAAYDHGQAMVVWQIARQMCKIAGWDTEHVSVRDYQGSWEIENPKMDSQYEPLTRKAASKHGINPFAVAFDELHTQPDRSLWDTLEGSMGAWSEPLLIAITNSGHDRQSICYHQREYAIGNNERGYDASHLGVIYGLSEDHEGVGAEDEWRRANPGVPVTVSLESVARKAAKAERQPSALDSFCRWQLGQWTRTASRWIDPAVWDDCEEDYQPADLIGQECYGGLDLGQVRDLTAWLLLFRDPHNDQLVRPVCRVWCPEARLTDEENPYREVYQAWERQGWLEVVRGRSINPGEIRPYILDDAHTYGMTDMAMDRYQGIQLSQELEADLGEGRVAGMGQGYSSMTGPCTEFERRLLAEPPLIRHRGHPVLTWAVQNVALKQTRDGDKRMPTKDSEDAIIDPVVALLMALDRTMRHEDYTDTGPSVYVQRAEASEGSIIRSL